ncbi:MAG: ABC transporter permease [Candidatus Nanohaloarchaea archaeon]
MRLRKKAPVVFRELRTVVKEGTVVSSFLFQLALLLFFSLALSGASAFMGASPGGEFDIGIAESAYSQNLSGIIGEQAQVHPRSTLVREKEEFDLVIVPENFSNRVSLQIYVDRSSIRSQFALQSVKSDLTLYEERLRKDLVTRLGGISVADLRESSGVPLEKARLSNLRWKFTYLMLMPVLLFLPVLLAGNLVIDSITGEYSDDTMELLRISPVSPVSIAFQKSAAYMVLGLFQAGLWVALFGFRGIDIQNPLPVLLTVGIFQAGYLFLSAAVGLKFRTRKEANLVYALIMALFVSTMGLRYNPFTVVSSLAVHPIGSVLRLEELMTYITVLTAFSAAAGLLLGKTARETLGAAAPEDG